MTKYLLYSFLGHNITYGKVKVFSARYRNMNYYLHINVLVGIKLSLELSSVKGAF
jgi:hypothetical protein